MQDHLPNGTVARGDATAQRDQHSPVRRQEPRQRLRGARYHTTCTAWRGGTGDVTSRQPVLVPPGRGRENRAARWPTVCSSDDTDRRSMRALSRTRSSGLVLRVVGHGWSLTTAGPLLAIAPPRARRRGRAGGSPAGAPRSCRRPGSVGINDGTSRMATGGAAEMRPPSRSEPCVLACRLPGCLGQCPTGVSQMRLT